MMPAQHNPAERRPAPQAQSQCVVTRDDVVRDMVAVALPEGRRGSGPEDEWERMLLIKRPRGGEPEADNVSHLVNILCYDVIVRFRGPFDVARLRATATPCDRVDEDAHKVGSRDDVGYVALHSRSVYAMEADLEMIKDHILVGTFEEEERDRGCAVIHSIVAPPFGELDRARTVATLDMVRDEVNGGYATQCSVQQLTMRVALTEGGMTTLFRGGDGYAYRFADASPDPEAPGLSKVVRGEAARFANVGTFAVPDFDGSPEVCLFFPDVCERDGRRHWLGVNVRGDRSQLLFVHTLLLFLLEPCVVQDEEEEQ
jgi:hypothetical protein